MTRFNIYTLAFGLGKGAKEHYGLVEMAKNVQLKEHIDREKFKLFEIWDNPEYDDDIQEDITNRIKRLSDELKVRQDRKHQSP